VANRSAGPDNAQWRRARDEALSVLNDVLLWSMPAARWEQVREAVANVAVAAATSNPDALSQAIDRLDLYSPMRVDVRLGDLASATRPVREQIAELVDILRLDSAPGRGSQAAPPERFEEAPARAPAD